MNVQLQLQRSGTVTPALDWCVQIPGNSVNLFALSVLSAFANALLRTVGSISRGVCLLWFAVIATMGDVELIGVGGTLRGDDEEKRGIGEMIGCKHFVGGWVDVKKEGVTIASNVERTICMQGSITYSIVIRHPNIMYIWELYNYGIALLYSIKM